MESYNYWSDKLAKQTMEVFSTSEEAKLWLKIHSIAKRDVIKGFIEKYNINLHSDKVEDKAVEIYNSITNDSIKEWNKKLDTYFNEENKKQFDALDINKLEQDLCLIQHFKWGGDQNNSLDKYFVTHYVKAIQSYKELKQKLETEALGVVENYVVSSWYNHWTSIVIEHLFKQHKKVLPTIGQIKSIDFIIDGIPFDLKVTYLPQFYQNELKGYLSSLGLPKTEIESLKKYAKIAKIKYGKAPTNEQHFQIRKLLENHNIALYNQAMEELDRIRDAKISYAKQHAKDLTIKLYENQGPLRFGSENRIYLILIDRNDMDNSWEMKRDFTRLKTEIDNYLDNFDVNNLNNMRLSFNFGGRQFTTYADTIFVVK